MDVWTDNILNTATLCQEYCAGETSTDFATSACLQCDEFKSGPAFSKAAGANRRSTGLVSDIGRDDPELDGTVWEHRNCAIGYFSSGG